MTIIESGYWKRLCRYQSLEDLLSHVPPTHLILLYIPALPYDPNINIQFVELNKLAIPEACFVGQAAKVSVGNNV